MPCSSNCCSPAALRRYLSIAVISFLVAASFFALGTGQIPQPEAVPVTCRSGTVSLVVAHPNDGQLRRSCLLPTPVRTIDESSLRGDIHVWWHIGVPQGRAVWFQRARVIVRRQFEKLLSGNLWKAAATIRISYVGPDPFPFDYLLQDGKAVLMVIGSSGHERDTMENLWRWSLRHPNDNGTVAYFHNKGVTRSPLTGSWDWAKMMEFFLVENYEDALSALREHATAGCELWSHPYNRSVTKLASGRFLHYQGNFWWARVEYIRTLPPPPKGVEEGSEDWILWWGENGMPRESFACLHASGESLYSRPVNHYQLPYPRYMYERKNLFLSPQHRRELRNLEYTTDAPKAAKRLRITLKTSRR
jgi:hypothetical protein